MSANVIQSSFAAGELSPNLYGQVDLAKYHIGAATMRNFFVDYHGGASTRAGTQLIGTPESNTYTKLVPFVFSTAVGQTYILVFSNLRLQFIKNPGGTPPHPNSSNSGFIISGGGPYTLTTPYTSADLKYLKYSQSADVMELTLLNPDTGSSYKRMELKRFADDIWSLTVPAIGTSVVSAGGVATITAPPSGSTDPLNTTYLYSVTAVDRNGQESNLSSFVYVTGLNMQITQGTVTIAWDPVGGASYYNVYKATPTPGGVIPMPNAPLGYIGYTQGNQFTDSNIIPDFTISPPLHYDPLDGGALTDYTITSPGSGYGVEGTVINISGTGSGALILPIITPNTAGGVGSITGLFMVNPGNGYSGTTTLTATGLGSGFAATVNAGPANTNPTCSAFFQQRLVLASTPAAPVTLYGSRPGFFNNFDVSNPVVDSDAFTFTLAAQQVNAIEHMVPMPGGLVLFSDGGVNQLTGGSSGANNPLAVTPTSAVIVPQSDYGCSAAVRPIKIDYDLIYPSSEGTIIIALAYNFFVNIYTGSDISILSSHLFYPLTITDWTWQNIPNKAIWATRSDGALLSCTYLKPQEILGWARHDTQGNFESVASVREGPGEGVYFVVNRGGQRYIERLCDRNYSTGKVSAWCLDCAQSYVGAPTTVVSGLTLEGATVYALADGVPRGPFVVTGGQITLPVAASTVVVGLTFQCQLQSLYLNLGSTENTVQGKRKKIAALSTRVKDAAGLKMGTTFSTLTPFIPGVSSTDPPQPAPPGLMTGDMRMQIDPYYSVGGQMCIQQDDPLPATVLAFIPELAMGDS